MFVWLPPEAPSPGCDRRDPLPRLTTRNYEWVFEADIKACFDEIDHTALMGRVRHRVGDKRVLGWVKAFLRAGILTEEGLNRETVTGTPQGGILSPLLSNIALSILDEHFANKWAALGPEWKRSKHRRAGGAVMRLVRYADDFVVLIVGKRADAEALWDEVGAVPHRWVCACRWRRRGSATLTRGSTSSAGTSSAGTGEVELVRRRSTPTRPRRRWPPWWTRCGR